MPGWSAAYVPPPAPEAPRSGRRRWWLAGIVVAWSLVLGGAVAWSVRHDPPTVPEQRDIVAARRVLDRAAGLVVAAGDGPAQTLEIGAVELDRDCALTPVRPGIGATQTILIRVRDGEAPAVLESVAAGLPGAYEPAVRRNAAGTRFTLRADAGDLVGVDATVRDGDTSVALRIATGCRPLADGVAAGAGNTIGAAEEPAAFRDALAALGGSGTGTASPAPPGGGSASGGSASGGAGPVPDLVRVSCPGGGVVATTFGATGLRAPADLGPALREVTGGATVVRAGAREWAYRSGDVSVVVTGDDGVATVRATTACRR